ncbi:glycoside hydrolase, partial [Exidia glandulosa HHB12029]
YFGSATDNPELSNTAYTKILFSDMFGQITPGNSMKWGPTEPSRDTYTYAQGDVVLNDAKNASQIVRAHNLAWYEQLPNWLSSGNFDNATLQTILTDHVTSAATHYKGQVYAWDVVNEPVDDSGKLDKVGTSYIDLAFRAAHAADPNAKLLNVSRSNLEYSGAKFNTTLNLVKQLVAQGTPIHGVGFEGHMIVGSVPSAANIASQMNQFTALGLEVAITELDIRQTMPETAAQRMQQKTDYQNMVGACMLVTKCVGVTVWDYTDLYSWVPSTFSGQGAACPWDSNFARKPAYDGIVLGLGGTS